ncbi:SDR family NAD(P)-dependent oxidoreductase [Microbulbifer sp. ALW1]|uniref:SDR family NAD(P)-dependent oxidoreductase n=1 Tax=Microbulbifer sp. (strain ALW1) TaxID=1516059 RepID=UPI00135A4B65|nr:SDR family NAD(P)-dependent oxidoreductase [Microbulbifer sp. ALW1]
MNSDKKLAVVTGGSAGIGREIALQLAAEGWDIAVNNLRDDAQAQSLIWECAQLGKQCFFSPCDVGDKAQVQGFYIRVREHFGCAPNLIVNNAGVQTWAPLLELQEEDWDRVIRTNLKGAFLNLQLGARMMVENAVNGSIVNIGSGCNKLAFPNLVDYAASKGGIEMLTKSAAVELGPHGIRVNCVAPGGILIDRTREEAPDYEKVWGDIAPLGRVGVPADIANAVIYLADPRASFVTGQTLWVDGGVFSKANWPY